jgi:hypothetical protein
MNADLILLFFVSFRFLGLLVILFLWLIFGYPPWRRGEFRAPQPPEGPRISSFVPLRAV